MEPEARYTLVGAVVLALAAMLAGVVVWLHGSGQGAGPTRLYAIYLRHQSVEGLEPRSAVTMRGIRVGTVTGLRFASGQADAVEVIIAASPSVPVLDTTRAIISRNLFTGLANVQLRNGGPGRPLARAGAALPVIAEGDSAEQAALATVNEVAQRANRLLSPENQAAVSQLLANAAQLSAHADRSLSRVDTALDEVGRATRRVSVLADSVAADSHALAARYDRLGSEAAGATRSAGDAIARASADVDRLSRRAESMLSAGGNDLHGTAQAVHDAADALGVAADRLREPGEILHGPSSLGPGEGKR